MNFITGGRHEKKKLKMTTQAMIKISIIFHKLEWLKEHLLRNIIRYL